MGRMVVSFVFTVYLAHLVCWMGGAVIMGLLIIVLLASSVYDVRFYRIPHIIPCSILLLAALQSSYPVCFWNAGLCFMALWALSSLTTWWHSRHRQASSSSIQTTILGGGDIKLMSACSVFLPLEQWGLWWIATGVLGLGIRALLSHDAIPLAPAISGAFVLCFWGTW